MTRDAFNAVATCSGGDRWSRYATGPHASAADGGLVLGGRERGVLTGGRLPLSPSTVTFMSSRSGNCTLCGLHTNDLQTEDVFPTLARNLLTEEIAGSPATSTWQE